MCLVVSCKCDKLQGVSSVVVCLSILIVDSEDTEEISEKCQVRNEMAVFQMNQSFVCCCGENNEEFRWSTFLVYSVY